MSQPIRVFGIALGRLYWLVAITLIALGLYVSLGRELVPMVAEYRSKVEQVLEQKLQMPVHLGQLKGQWQGLSPVLVLQDLSLGPADHQLLLDQVRIYPDVLQSLLQWRPNLSEVQVEGLKLSLEQQADGHWQLNGLPKSQRQAPVDFEQLFQQSQMLQRLTLVNSQMTVAPLDHDAFSFTYASLSARNGIKQQRIDARLLMPDGNALELNVRSQLKVLDWKTSAASLYLKLPESNWAQWLPPSLLPDIELKQARLGGQVWLDWQDGHVQRAVAQLQGSAIEGRRLQQPTALLEALKLQLSLDKTSQGYALQADQLSAQVNQTALGPSRLRVSQQQDDVQRPGFQLQADQLAIKPLFSLLEAYAPLSTAAAERIQELAPRGDIKNLRLTFTPDAPLAERLDFAANLYQIGVDPSRGVPGLEKVTGLIQGGISSGELRADSPDFSLHLNQFFPKPWHFHRANALLQWRFDDQAFSLISPYLQARGDEGPVAGDFMIRLMRDPEAESYMDLRVGMRDGDARYTEKFLPTLSPAMGEGLSQWLIDSIRAGQVKEGWFQYQGSLKKDSPAHSRAISLFFDVAQGQLAFQPGWPVLQEVKGKVFVEPHGVRVTAEHGRLLDSHVSQVNVQVPLTDPARAPRLAIEGQLQSSVQDALSILQSAPIGTEDIFKGWTGEGALSGAIKLDIPLRKDAKALHAQVDFSADGGHVQMQNPNLQLQQVKGDFRYDTAKGLSAPTVNAKVFGENVKASIYAQGRGQPSSRVEAKGQVRVDVLSQWLGITQQPLPVSGRLPYALNLTIDGPDSQLHVASTLQGTAIDLPAPFGKSPEQVRDSHWRMTLQGPQRRYWLDYGQLARFTLAAPVGKLMDGRAELRLGTEPAQLPTSSGLRVRGQVERVVWDDWQQWVTRYTASGEQGNYGFFKGAELQIGQFEGFGTQTKKLQVGAYVSPEQWRVALNSAQFKGTVKIPKKQDQALNVELEYLNMPAPEPVTPGPKTEPLVDPLAQVDLKRVPAIDVRIERLSRGAKVLGRWQFKVRPTAKGVAFREIDLNLSGLNILGSATWEGAPGSMQSHFSGKLQGKDLAQVLTAFDYAPSVGSESFRVYADGSWPGSVAAFSLSHYSGLLDASLRNGQINEVQGSAQALRLFGLLNFNSIGRRLRLDFSDLLGKGLSYDRFKGALHAENGVFYTQEPIIFEGPSSNLAFKGRLDMLHEEVDAKLLVTLPVSNNLPLAALIVGAPAVGGALFLVDKLLGDQVARFASVQYKVSGPLDDPQLDFDHKAIDSDWGIKR